MNTATRTAIDVLTPVIARAARKAAERSPGVDYGDVHRITNDVTKEVAAVVVNQTNSEEWWRSRVTWGAIIAVGAGLAGIAGYTFDAEDQAVMVNAIVGAASVIGGLIAWYGRWRAKKPLGQ